MNQIRPLRLGADDDRKSIRNRPKRISQPFRVDDETDELYRLDATLATPIPSDEGAETVDEARWMELMDKYDAAVKRSRQGRTLALSRQAAGDPTARETPRSSRSRSPQIDLLVAVVSVGGLALVILMAPCVLG
jgi:hypothetical protein